MNNGDETYLWEDKLPVTKCDFCGRKLGYYKERSSDKVIYICGNEECPSFGDDYEMFIYRRYCEFLSNEAEKENVPPQRHVDPPPPRVEEDPLPERKRKE